MSPESMAKSSIRFGIGSCPGRIILFHIRAMKVFKSVVSIRKWQGSGTGKIVMVPTMGALHRGHGALIKKARILAGKDGRVIVSIFVNPTQFGPKEDLSRYPRPFEADAKMCKELGADAIFHPSPEIMYSGDFSTYVDEHAVSQGLCGASRPGHFRGVCTVVLKLFNICAPDVAVFGLKDYQQCQVIARMVRDLAIPVRLVFSPTIRENDGLALSSRNVYLSREERIQAPVIRRALLSARDAFRTGEISANKLRSLVEKEISKAPLARIDYVSTVDGSTLKSVKNMNTGDTIAVAAFFGKTRLIDNIQLG
jgi:pantoate--beta-alanine ligase